MQIDLSTLDFARYTRFRDDGFSPEQIVVRAEADGLGPIQRVKVLMHVFGFSVATCKEVIMRADASGELQAFHDELMNTLGATREEMP